MDETATARLDRYLVDENTPFDLAEIAAASEEAPEVQKFRVENKDQANWALRKLVAIERDRAEARSAAQAETNRIQAWLAEEEKRADQSRVFFDFLLEDYHRKQLAENPKAKTIKLLHGETQLRATAPVFNRDDNVLLGWALKNRRDLITLPYWVRPAPKLDWAGLKKTLKVHGTSAVDPESGEFIPGITVIEQPMKFSIKLSGV